MFPSHDQGASLNGSNLQQQKSPLTIIPGLDPPVPTGELVLYLITAGLSLRPHMGITVQIQRALDALKQSPFLEDK